MPLTDVRERLEAALRGNELGDLVAEWRREGKSQVEIYDVSRVSCSPYAEKNARRRRRW